MVKPFSEDGAPIKYFSASKPTKKDKGNWARQNRVAYDKAMSEIMLRAAQYEQKHGHPSPNYALRTNLPAPEPAKFRPSLPGEERDSRDFFPGRASGSKGTTRKRTEREETLTLQERKANNARIVEELAADAKSGRLRDTVEGINDEKEDKPWYEKVGGVIADVSNAAGRQVFGDVAGRALEFINRGSAGVSGEIVKNQQNPVLMDIDEDLRKEILADGGPKAAALIESEKKMKERGYKRAGHGWVPADTNALGVSPQNLYALRRGLTGKEHHSVTEITIPRLQKNIPALRPNKNDPWWLSGLKMTPGIASGTTMDVVGDPANVIGVGFVARGVQAARDVRRLRTAEEVVSDVKTAGHVADVARQSGMLKAPLELEAISQSTRRAQQASTGFEIGGEAQLASRAAEMTAEATKAQKIGDATEVGYKALVNQAKAEARRVASAKKLVVKGKLNVREWDKARALHKTLLKRVAEADELRAVAKATPVGGRLTLLEKRASRLARLAAKHPENPTIVRKADTARKELETARVAAIPENAERVLRVAEKVATGAKITPEDIEAVVNAAPDAQDAIIAAAKASEEMPGKANLVDEVLGGTKAGAKAATTLTGDAADLPSNRFVQAINKAMEDAMTSAPSEETLSEAAKLALDEATDKNLRARVTELIEDAEVSNKKWSKGTIKSTVAREMAELAETDPIKEAAMASAGRKLAVIKKSGEKLIPTARKQLLFEEAIAEEIIPTAEAMERLLLEGTSKRVVIRFGTKDLGEFKHIGEALTKAYAPFELVGKVGGTHGGKTLAKMFRMGAHFEGETNYIRQMAENSGTVAHKAWAKRIQETFAGITRAEAKQVTHALEDGITFDDPKLEAWRQAAEEMNEHIFAEQARIGKYIPHQKVKGYIYHYYHSRNKQAIKDFKGARNVDLKTGLKGPTLATAAGKGLKPETEIDKILMMQHRDFVRDLQRANFRQMVMSQHGVLTDNPALANTLSLQKVSEPELNKMFLDKAAGAGKGATWYLPPDIHDTFKAMDRLMNIGFNPEAEQFMGVFDTLVRGYKTSATIGNPANWINNTIGDFFLNWMDGVKNPAWYKKAASALRAEGAEVPKTLGVAGSAVDTNSLLRDFRLKAPSGGFIGTEGLGPLSRVRGYPTKVTHGIQGGYEKREEWVRFTHFLHATDDEARKLIRAGKGKTFEDVRETATELAAKRISKWNIDYTELTPFERQLRKRYIPFYTFVRKATPLMLEGMILRPGKMNQYQRSKRSIEQFLGIPPMEDDGTNWPTWTKEQGITRLTNENEPLYLRDPSPLNVINRITGGETQRAPIANLLNMSSPLIRGVGELASGRSLYNDKPIDDWKAWTANQIPSVSIIARAAGHPLSPQKKAADESVDVNAGTAILERLGVFGIPIGRNTEARQQAALHGELEENSDIQKRVKEAIAPYKITSGGRGDNKTYIAKDPAGNVIGRYPDFMSAVRATQDSLASAG